MGEAEVTRVPLAQPLPLGPQRSTEPRGERREHRDRCFLPFSIQPLTSGSPSQRTR